MSSRYVTKLVYEVVTDRNTNFDKAPPLTVTGPSCTITVDKTKPGEYKAVVEMTDQFVTSKEAREVVEPFLRLWELWDDLNHQNSLRFHFAEAVDSDNDHELVLRLTLGVEGDADVTRSE